MFTNQMNQPNHKTHLLKHTRHVLLLAGMLMGLNGCATLSKQECLIGDWRAIGYKDGVAGRSAGRIDGHQKACAKAGVSINYKLWEAGRKEGLMQYCTESNALQLGERGVRLNSVCPSHIAPKLQKINADAKREYDLKKQIDRDYDKIEEYQDKLRKLRNGDMLHFTTEREARTYMLELDDKIDNLRRRIRDTEMQLANIRLYR